jgi:hypothetical protein
MNDSPADLFPPGFRVTQVSDEGPTPSFFIRFRDPVAFLTTNWNYITSAEFDLANRMLASAHIGVVQRAFSSGSQRLMEACKSASIPVIYETDDLMMDLPPQSGFMVTEPQKTAIKCMLKSADLVTCSTQPLAERLSEHNASVKVLENYAIPFPLDRIHSARTQTPHLALVNTDYFKLTEAKDGLFSALAKAISELDYRVTFFGTTDESMAVLQARFPDSVVIVSSFIPWRRPFLSALMERGINAAIVPLEKSAHHRFKSDIKFMDFASIGVPAIFNHEEIYRRVVHKQNGFLCDGTYDGWLEGLAYLADQRTRDACGDAAHTTAHQRTLGDYASEFAGAMLALLD